MHSTLDILNKELQQAIISFLHINVNMYKMQSLLSLFLKLLLLWLLFFVSCCCRCCGGLLSLLFLQLSLLLLLLLLDKYQRKMFPRLSGTIIEALISLTSWYYLEGMCRLTNRNNLAKAKYISNLLQLNAPGTWAFLSYQTNTWWKVGDWKAPAQTQAHPYWKLALGNPRRRH